MQKIKIFDETLRDGEQQARVIFTPEQKNELADKISSAGVDYINIMAGIHDSEDSLIADLVQKSLPIVPACMMGKEYVQKALKAGVNKVIMFYSVSDILLKAKNKTRENALDLSKKWVDYAREHGLKVDFAAEDATRADFDYLVEFGHEMKPFIDHFMICDTVGCLQPNLSYKLVKDFIDSTGCKVSVHYHNDLGMAVENTIQGVLAGASTVSGTFTGIGERAGNVPLETVLLQLRDNHGIFAENFYYNKLPDICYLVAKHVGFGPAEPLSEEAFYNETGIHVHALLRDPRSYCIFPGRNPIIWFGKYSGASNFEYVFERMLRNPQTKERYNEMRETIKNLAVKNQRSYSADEVITMFNAGKI